MYLMTNSTGSSQGHQKGLWQNPVCFDNESPRECRTREHIQHSWSCMCETHNQHYPKWRKNMKPETLELLEENTGHTLYHICNEKTFFKKEKNAKGLKSTTDSWDFMKLKSFCYLTVWTGNP